MFVAYKCTNTKYNNNDNNDYNNNKIYIMPSAELQRCWKRNMFAHQQTYLLAYLLTTKQLTECC